MAPWGCFRERKLREVFFIKNGAQLLEDSIASFEGGGKPIRMFSAKELQEATNNYAADQILDEDVHYITYKGVHENRTIAVKKYREKFNSMGCAFIEAVILSYVNHRNVVKLIGCCIETQTPIIVSEFLSNGTLFHLIHEVDPSNRMSWESRLRVAIEIAYGLAYLHIATSRPIIVRNIKSKNILLDESYTAKITDFGLSVLIPMGETFVETEHIAGSIGYIDPQYLKTWQLTDKSDVFSFGVVLIELLTGKWVGDEEFREFHHGDDDDDDDDDGEQIFITTEMERIVGIMNACITEEGNENQLSACVELAIRCIRRKGEKRPTMKEVVEELRRIKRI